MHYNIAQALTLQQQFVVPKARVHAQRPRRKLAHLLPPIFLFAALLLQLIIRIEITERGYTLESLREEALKADNELRTLRLQLALVTTPTRLTDVAEQKLGMNPLCPQRVRQIKAAE